MQRQVEIDGKSQKKGGNRKCVMLNPSGFRLSFPDNR